MFCQKCGTENPETATFCMKCGNPINQDAVPEKKKSKKTLWIVGIITILILLLCITPAGYAYYKVKNFIATYTPTSTNVPKTAIPTDIPRPEQVIVNNVEDTCVPVYKE